MQHTSDITCITGSEGHPKRRAAADGAEEPAARVGGLDLQVCDRLLDLPQDVHAAAGAGRLRRVRPPPLPPQPRHDVRAPGLGPRQHLLLQGIIMQFLSGCNFKVH